MRPVRSRLLPLAFIALALSQCRRSPGAAAPGTSAPGVKSWCENNATLGGGAYHYENNEWGWAKEHSRYEQCLLEREVSGTTERGWSWAWPGQDSSVFAYPEIIYGWKPWTGGKSSDPRFPLKLSAMQELKIDYAVETQATGSYNLAPEVWLISGRPSAGARDPGLITAEIMFWVEAAGVARPGGSVVDHPTILGKEYELWQLDHAGDNGRGGWRLLSVKTPTTERAGTIPVDEILRYLAQKGFVSADHLIASVEFGNEISGGEGTTWVKQFAVRVSP